MGLPFDPVISAAPQVTGAYQSGHSQLSSAKSLSPNYTQQFIIFVREQVRLLGQTVPISCLSGMQPASAFVTMQNPCLLSPCRCTCSAARHRLAARPASTWWVDQA